MKKIFIIIALLAGILVSLWFRDGLIMGIGEDSLVFYNISRFLPESQYAWMEHPGLGRVTIGLTAARPTYELLAFLQRLGLENFVIQAIVFWFALFSAGVGIYLLVREFFPQLPNKYILLSVLFYWFNPLALVGVWNRFLADYIFAFGLLPIASFLFTRGLNRRNYIWSFILILILPLYSFAFTFVAFDILLWIFFFIITLLFCLVYKEFRARLFFIKFFLLTFLFFLLTNFWWIGQLISLNLFKNINSSVLNFDASANLSTLDALSKKMGNLSDIFRLVNASFLNENSLSWVKKFYSMPFMLLQYLVAALILYSIAKGRKIKSVLILGGLLFISMYLAKGMNPPFGEIYQFIFTNVPYLQVFRNPFEKASFVLSLSASLLIGFSVFSLSEQMAKKYKGIFYFAFLGFIVMVWGFPFYSGLVFTFPEPPANNPQIGFKVKVPSYYQDADRWLASKGNNFRFIGFPLGSEGITYNWEKGYVGVELSSALFSTPGILHNTAVPYFYDLVPQIQPILLANKDFIKIANALNAKFFFTRHDIDYVRRQMTDPALIDNNFLARENNGEVKKVATFDKLTFWENLKWQDRTFYSATKIINSAGKQQVSELLNLDVNKGEVLMDAGNTLPTEATSSVNISYKYRKINPAKYIVHIENSTPFILIFSELFNDAWQASSVDRVYPHKRVNFYANGWLIDKTGKLDLVIEYLPQSLLELGEKVSIYSYLVTGTGVIVLLLKFGRNRKK